MKKWVRENYTIEKMFSCWGRNYYIYPVTYQGNLKRKRKRKRKRKLVQIGTGNLTNFAVL